MFKEYTFTLQTFLFLLPKHRYVYVTEFAGTTPDLPANLDAVKTWDKAGTLEEFITNFETVTVGNLTAKDTSGDEAYLGIALHMQEDAGNQYQGKDLGTFDITIQATQDNVEADDFGTEYDATAEFVEEVATEAEFVAALKNGGNITLNSDLVLAESYTVIEKDAVIDLNGHKISSVRACQGAFETAAVLTVDGVNVTITGEGSIDNSALGQDVGGWGVYLTNGGTLTIESGTYHGKEAAVYVTNGNLIINGGTFSSVNGASPVFNYSDVYEGVTYYMYHPRVINCSDKQYKAGNAKVTIYGGTFINEDPSNVHEGDYINHSLLAAGYKTVAQDAEGSVVSDPQNHSGDVHFVVVPDTTTP